MSFEHEEDKAEQRRDTDALCGKHAVVMQTSASFMPTFTAHGGHRLLQLRPLSICMVADTDVDPGLLPAVGAAFLCNQGGSVGDGKAGETAG